MPSHHQFGFTVRNVSLGLDEDDEPMSSLVIDFGETPATAAADQDGAWTPSLAVLRRIMMSLSASAGEMIQLADGTEVRAIREEKIREEFYRQRLGDGAEDKQEARRRASRRAVTTAQARGLIACA